MVSNDEKDIHIDELDLSIAPHRVRLRSGTPDLKKQGSFGERRRTRSASPAVTESTLSAVQRYVSLLDNVRMINFTKKIFIHFLVPYKRDMFKSTI